MCDCKKDKVIADLVESRNKLLNENEKLKEENKGLRDKIKELEFAMGRLL
ncbi:unnamed protein product [marine sediment metagenome]|uniref:Uncharacterized protein n=1 Tax=marine sediment metagenome TaxID=412755 RepID=X0Y0A6_9ZZZZ